MYTYSIPSKFRTSNTKFPRQIRYIAQDNTPSSLSALISGDLGRGVESRVWADGGAAGLQPPPPAGDRESLPAEDGTGKPRIR